MYLQCGDETVNSDGYLWLDENVKVQVGGGVKASGTWTYTGGDVNPNELVYPIRGTMDKYLCGKVQHGSVLENEGKNCTLWHWNEATGNCYRTTFGDWKCTMTDLDAQQVADQPPPTK
ncbi:MAG TPA: hypothetical protein VMU71_07565 [Terracidiphilus sp.]|nr:hypothetical protein [Terracidiphilus sp.]